MRPLSKGDIFNAPDLPREPVEVPEWGGTVWVRTLTAAERDAYQASLVKVGRGGRAEARLDNASGRLAALCCCDEAGRRIFDDDDAGELGRKSARALDRIVTVANRLNGLSEDAVEKAAGN